MKNISWMAGTAMALVLTAPAFAAPPARAAPAQPALSVQDMTQVAKNDKQANRGNSSGQHDNRVASRDTAADQEPVAASPNPNAWKARYPYGVSAYPAWSRRDTLFRKYWQPQYRVKNWKSYGLARPAPGTHWVRAHDIFMLVPMSDASSGR